LTASGLFRELPPPLRPGRPASDEQRERRAMTPPPPLPAGARFETVAGTPCLVAAGEKPVCRVIHMHGGAYYLGSAALWGDFASRYAAAAEAEVWVPDYPLAPEHPFPAALHAMIAVIEALVAADPTVPLFLSGDSAGGGLALALATLMRRPLPFAGIVLFSPWLDLTVTSAGYARCAETDTMFSEASARKGVDAYLQGADPHHPLASPLFADIAGLPELTLMISTDEVLADEAMSLAQRLLHARVPFQLHAVPGVPHVWPMLAPGSVHSGRALATLGHLFRQNLARCEAP